MDSAANPEYSGVQYTFRRVSDTLLTVWKTHVEQYFPAQAAQFTRSILTTLEMHRERVDYLQAQLDKVVGLAVTAMQTGTPINLDDLIDLTGVPNARG